MLNKLSFAIMIFSWIVFASGFIYYFKIPLEKKRAHSPLAAVGFIFEASAFAAIFIFHRALLTDIYPADYFLRLVFSFAEAVIASISVWLCISAFKELGKQWSPSARILEDHELIVSGPYNIVRHPIYGGMFGLMIITGYVVSEPWALLLGMFLYFTGTIFRIKVEENLLIKFFGKRYKNYKAQTKAFIPFIF